MWPYGAAPDVALLCPVPAMHLASVPLDGTARRVVAFGTNSAALWGWARGEPPVIREGAQVFIFPTVSRVALPVGSAAAALMRQGAHTACRAGRFRGLREAVVGLHPDEGARPPTTIHGAPGIAPDTDWDLFWEVDEFTECRVKLDEFRTFEKRQKFAPSFKLHGPVLARGR